MNDSRALGFPFTIVLGKKYEETKQFEIQIRNGNTKEMAGKDDLIKLLRSKNKKT
jgi:prolyl-tRNA synthetase